MTRRSSKKKSGADVGPSKSLKVTINLEDSDDERAPPPSPPIQDRGKHQKQKSKKKKSKQSKIAKKAAVETPDDSEQDELGNDQQLVPKPGRKDPSHVNSGREKEVMKALEKAVKILSSIGSQADIKKILQQAGSRNDDASNHIQTHCATISAMLSPITPAATALVNCGEVPSTIHHYDQYFAHLGPGRRIYILRPVEVLQGNTNLTRRKVTGFIQHKGSNFPLKYALPGWTPCVDDHPNVLDFDFWTKEVQRWGTFHNHHFPNHPFDAYHGKDKGHACASHVEPRLMLWYACDRLRELCGIEKPIRTLLGELFRLRDYNEIIEAEIFLTRPPCKKCLEIKQLIEDYTRIVFHIRVFPNLGELQAQKSKHGWVTFPTHAQVNDEDEHDEEDMAFEEDVEEEVEVVERQETVEKTKSTFAVVIRGNPNTPKKQTKPKQQQLTPPSTKSSTVTKTSTMTQKRHIRSFSYQPANALLINDCHQDQNSDSDVSDYQPPSSSQRKSNSKSTYTKTPNQDSYLFSTATPVDSPFGADAHRQAKLLKREREKKRRAQEHDSPSLGKKARYAKF